MLVEETLYISPKHTAKDYLNLKLNLKSNNDDWITAIDILKDRIEGRYLNPIQQFLQPPTDTNNNNNIVINGFAAMALMCLLIDTFMQFRFGFPQTPTKKIGEYYKLFMTRYLKYGTTEANVFYRDIRCGILHSAETKNGSYLIPETNSNSKTIEILNNGLPIDNISVNVKAMFEELEKYFKNYCKELLDSKNTECRKGFLAKMNALTTKHDFSKSEKELWKAICKKQDKSRTYQYTVDEEKQTLTIMNPYDTISFSDIKNFICCTNQEIQNSFPRSEYIKQILQLCIKEVKEYNPYYSTNQTITTKPKLTSSFTNHSQRYR